MADCGSNRTLDPFQIILDNIDRTTTTLERQARDILPDVTDFRNEGEGFIEGDISPSETVDNAMTAFTKEAICASKTDLEPINQFIEDCLNDALRGVRQYLNEILGNVEDGIDLIEEILALPEKNLMQLLQKIWKLCDNIANLVSGIDGKLQCIISLDQSGQYTDQVTTIQNRVDTVIDDLYLADDGSFDHERLTTGFNEDLRTNLDKYYNRSVDLQQEINDDVDETIQLASTVNPRSKF